MVGVLLQAVTNKQMVCFLYRGMKRYVTPTRVEPTSQGAMLCGLEHGSPAERRYNVGEMVGLALLQDPSVPEARRFTPWVYGEEGEEKLTPEEKIRKATSNM